MKYAILLIVFFFQWHLYAQEEYSLIPLQREPFIDADLSQITIFDDCDLPLVGVKDPRGEVILPAKYTSIERVMLQTEWFYQFITEEESYILDRKGQKLILPSKHHFWTPEKKDLKDCFLHKGYDLTDTYFDRENTLWECYYLDDELKASMFKDFTNVERSEVLYFNKPVKYWKKDNKNNRLWVETETYNYVFDLNYNLLVKTEYKVLKVFENHLMIMEPKLFHLYDYPYELRRDKRHVFKDKLKVNLRHKVALMAYSGELVFPFKNHFYGVYYDASNEPTYWVFDKKRLSVYTNDKVVLIENNNLLPKVKVDVQRCKGKVDCFDYFEEYTYLNHLADTNVLAFYYTQPKSNKVGAIKKDGSILMPPIFDSVIALNNAHIIRGGEELKPVSFYHMEYISPRIFKFTKDNIPLVAYNQDSIGLLLNAHLKLKMLKADKVTRYCIGNSCYLSIHNGRYKNLLNTNARALFPDTVINFSVLSDSLLVVKYPHSQSLYKKSSEGWSAEYSADTIHAIYTKGKCFPILEKSNNKILLNDKLQTIFPDSAIGYKAYADSLFVVEFKYCQTIYQKVQKRWDAVHTADSFYHIGGSVSMRKSFAHRVSSGIISERTDNWVVVKGNRVSFYSFNFGKWRKERLNRVKKGGRFTEFTLNRRYAMHGSKTTRFIVDTNLQVVFKGYNYIQLYSMGYWVNYDRKNVLLDENFQPKTPPYKFTGRKFGELFEFREGDCYGLYNANEEKVILEANDSIPIDFVKNDMIKRGNQMYSMDGNFIFDTKDTRITADCNGFILEKGGKYGFYYKGKLLMPLEYDHIEVDYQYLQLYKDGEIIFYSFKNPNNSVTCINAIPIVKGRGGSRWHLLKNKEGLAMLVLYGEPKTPWLPFNELMQHEIWNSMMGYYGLKSIYQYRGLCEEAKLFLVRTYLETDSIQIENAFGTPEKGNFINYSTDKRKNTNGVVYSTLWIDKEGVRKLNLNDFLNVDEKLISLLNSKIQTYYTDTGIKAEACYKPEFLKMLHNSFIPTKNGLRIIFQYHHTSKYHVYLLIEYDKIEEFIPKGGLLESFLEQPWCQEYLN